MYMIISQRFSLMHIELDDHERALKALKDARDLAKEMDDPYLKAQAYQGLGFVRYNMGDWERSLKYYRMSRKFWRELGNLDMESVAEAGMGEVSRSLRQYPPASGGRAGSRRALARKDDRRCPSRHLRPHDAYDH